MLTSAPGLLPLDHYRLQLYNYAMAERLRCGQYAGGTAGNPMCPSYPIGPYGPRLALSMSLFHNRVFQPEEPKPQHSYIGLIAMAILSTADHKLVLSDIYQHILDNYPYFRSRGPGWRNSIRHNLSLNDCFIKAGRSANGKGHYWAIHPANLEDFKKGDFRRRKAQRKVRKHMGLAVDDEGTDSPSPPPCDGRGASPPPGLQGLCAGAWGTAASAVLPGSHHHHHHTVAAMYSTVVATTTTTAGHSASRKRQFDVASLLAPDDDPASGRFTKPAAAAAAAADAATHYHHHLHHLQSVKRLSIAAAAAAAAAAASRGADIDEDIDVVANDQDEAYAPDRRSASPRSCDGSNHNDDDRYAAVASPPSPSNHLHPQHSQQHQQLQQHPQPDIERAPAWHGLMQQWPTGFSQQLTGMSTMDPRILGRYYGQYMAAAQHASRRLNAGEESAAATGPPSTLQSNDC